MIKKYFNHIRSKTPHRKRQHAAQVAGVFTVLAFVVWITTLGMRFGGAPAAPQMQNPFDTSTSPDQTQVAGAAASADTANTTGTPFSSYDGTSVNQ